MANNNHILRHHYPEFFGNETITNTKKQWFVKADILPVCVIVVLFAWLAWSSGHIEPVRRVNELKAQIEKTNNYFDDRAKKTVSLIDSIRKKLEANELNELNVINGEILGGRITALESLNKIEKAIARLTLNKPNDEAIETRLKAAIEFAELSQQIVDKRDLRQYDLAFRFAKESDGESDQATSEEKTSVTERITGVFDKFDLAAGSEASNLIGRGKRTIEQAEQFLDPLNEPEQEAKALLAKFDGLVMPRREHELLKHINKEWNTQYFALLEHWKSVRKLEIVVDETIKKRAELLAEQQARAAAEADAETEKKEPAKSSTLRTRPRQTESTQRVVKPRPKTPREIREEKRRKALELIK